MCYYVLLHSIIRIVWGGRETQRRTERKTHTQRNRQRTHTGQGWQKEIQFPDGKDLLEKCGDNYQHEVQIDWCTEVNNNNSNNIIQIISSSSPINFSNFSEQDKINKAGRICTFPGSDEVDPENRDISSIAGRICIFFQEVTKDPWKLSESPRLAILWPYKKNHLRVCKVLWLSPTCNLSPAKTAGKSWTIKEVLEKL